MTEQLKPCPFCGAQSSFHVGCQTHGCLGNYLWRDAHPETISAWNTRAAPKVKPLVWFGNGAESILGTYFVAMEERAREDDSADTWFWHVGSRESGPSYKSRQEAKDAAQADYERRIREALE